MASPAKSGRVDPGGVERLIDGSSATSTPASSPPARSRSRSTASSCSTGVRRGHPRHALLPVLCDEAARRRHRAGLLGRGELDEHQPITTWFPEFGGNGQAGRHARAGDAAHGRLPCRTDGSGRLGRPGVAETRPQESGLSLGFVTSGYDRHEVRGRKRTTAIGSLAAACATS
jgi:hypothetical protein